MSAPIQLPLDLPEIDAEVAGGARLRRSILPSGVRLITEDVPGAASAAIGCFVPLGSRDETETEYGSSHFLEHLLFKGTPTRSAREVALEFDRVGGDFNAATSREQTVYHARVRDHDLPMAIEVLADMLTSSLIDPVEFETERGVILEEIASAGDDPIDVLWERFYATHFDGHPLGRPIAGTRESILATTRDQVDAFYRANYRPDTLVVAIAGRVDHDAARELLEAGLRRGGWDLDAPGAPHPRRHATPYARTPRRRFERVERELEQTNLIIGSHGIAATDRRRSANGMLHHILGGGMSSRLFQEVRERRGLVYSVFSFSATHADAGVMGVYVGCRPDKAAEAVRVVRAEIERIAADGVERHEIDDALGAGAGAGALALESNAARMHRLGRAELVLGEFLDLDASVERLRSVTGEDLRELAAMLVEPGRTIETIGPLSDEALDELERLP
ncbi:MAG: insulinase family protein [Microbacteriaceae bacterium]|nr:insulinase family protein [Microbacteriaceae bacterium]